MRRLAYTCAVSESPRLGGWVKGFDLQAVYNARHTKKDGA